MLFRAQRKQDSENWLLGFKMLSLSAEFKHVNQRVSSPVCRKAPEGVRAPGRRGEHGKV